MIWPALIVFIAATITSCAAGTPDLASRPVSAPTAGTIGAHVTGTYPTSCHRSPADDPRLPVRTCTPGATRLGVSDPATFPSTICRPGWIATVRPPSAETDRAKTLAMAAYGIPPAQRGVIELDHLIPLELGGSNDVRNLWPELSDEPGHDFRNTKDGVENRLKAAVCAHRVTLPATQSAMAADWTTAEARLGLNGR